MKSLNTWLPSADGVLGEHNNTAHMTTLLHAVPLTSALRALGGDFSVRVLHLGAVDLYDDELPLFDSALASSKRVNGFGREVALCLNGTPVVWARSVCLAQAAVWREAMDCGTQPLGTRLYDLPAERGAFEFARLSAAHPANANAFNPNAGEIVARRSSFVLQDACLLLTECFLPALSFYSVNVDL